MFSRILVLMICAFLVNLAGAQTVAAGVVLNGANNTASGDYSGAGGVGSTSGGVGGFVWGIGSRQLGGGSAFGRNLKADGTDSHVTGQGVVVLRDNGWGSGWNNLSSGMQGSVSGHQSNDRGIQGADARAIGSFTNTGDSGFVGVGDAQRIELILRTITTDGTPEQLSSSAYNVVASTAPNINVLTVPDNGTLRVKGGVVAREPATGASRSWELTALIKRGVGAGSTTLVGAAADPEFGDSAAAGWGFNFAADTANGSLALVATGQAGKTIQWVARIVSVENVGGSTTPPPPSAPSGCTVTADGANPLDLTAPKQVTLSAQCTTGSPTSFTWSANAGLPSAAASGQVQVNSTQTFTVTPANASGPGNTVSVAVSVVPPPTGSNVALASAGGVSTASTTYNDNYPVFSVNDGDRIGRRWGQGSTGSGWNDGTTGAYPDWVQVQFSAARTINRVVVYTMQDGNPSGWIEPTDTTTFSSINGGGILDFQVQGWNGTTWTVLGSAVGNNLVKRTFQFANFTTDRIRLWITKASPDKSYDYSRVVEIEAFVAN